MPSKYTPELKTRAIELVLHAQADPDTARGAVSRVADELNISRETLRIWVTQTQGIRRHLPDGVGGPGSRKPQAAQRTRRITAGQRDPQEGFGFLRGGARATHTSSRRLHRRQPCSIRGRADHPGPVRHARPHRREHVLRREKPTFLRPGRPGRSTGCCTAPHLHRQLLLLRRKETVGRDQSRWNIRPRRPLHRGTDHGS